MKYLFAILLCFPLTTYSDISKISIYPSQIKVSFKAPKKTLPTKNVKLKKQKNKSVPDSKQVKNEQSTLVSAQEFVTFTKFIRIINGINLKNNNKTALIFFNENNESLEVNVVENSPKPQPHQIFFIDKSFGRHFQGKIDLYYIPENASYFIVGIINTQNRFLKVATHNNFSSGGKIYIADYNKIAPSKKIMLQIELLGSVDAILTRACAFSFF